MTRTYSHVNVLHNSMRRVILHFHNFSFIITLQEQKSKVLILILIMLVEWCRRCRTGALINRKPEPRSESGLLLLFSDFKKSTSSQKLLHGVFVLYSVYNQWRVPRGFLRPKCFDIDFPFHV